MKTFLDHYETQLPAAQAAQIATIVAQRMRQGEVATGGEIADEVQRLLQVVRRQGEFQPSLHVRESVDARAILTGEFFNDAMESLDLDLRTLYEVANQQTGIAGRLKTVLHSRLEELRAGISRLADDIVAQRLQKGNQYARVITQGFADGRNDTVAGQKAEIDPQTRTLKLSARSQQRYHQRRGVNPAQVVVTQLSGGQAGVASRTFEPDRAIDPDPDTFWADVLLADSPIRTDYTFVDGSTKTYDGALVAVELQLGAPEFVTDVKILPFGDFPVDIIDVKIRQGEAIYQYPGFVDRTPSLNWLEWHGPRIQADAVIFVLQQQNYQKVRLHLPAELLAVASFWEQLLDEESRLTLDDAVLTTQQQQLANADAHYNSLYEGLRRYGVNIQRFDLPIPDPNGRVVKEDEVLRRQVDATLTTMFGLQEVSGVQVDHLRSSELPPQERLVEVEKYEYVFGAREIQANEADYANEGYYASPQYAANSTILEVRLNTDEEHPSFDVGEGAFHQTSIEYEVELAQGRRAPILPKGTTLVQDELLVLDRTTREDTTRFPAASTTVTVRRGGYQLDTGDYTVVQLTDGRLRVTIDRAAYFRSARYSIDYTPEADQDVLDIDALFDSVLLDKPEIFEGTDQAGAIELAHYPYVEYGVVNNEDLFRREAKRSARYLWLGGRQQVFLDGVMYGDVNTRLDGAIDATVATISLTTVTGLPTAGSLKIEDEVIAYTSISGLDLIGVTRGTDGSTAAAHNDQVAVVGERSYEPLIVTVGNVAAYNITDYRSGDHPAFLSTSEDTVRYEYLHIGRRLYFNRPISGKPIAVRYRWMSQYIQIHALLRSHTVGRVPQTPILRNFHTEIVATAL